MSKVKELTIQTATVEIKSIKVGGQKMTISVFNQIPFESFIEDDFSIREGVDLWGWVSAKDNEYILYVEGGILKKAYRKTDKTTQIVAGILAKRMFNSYSVSAYTKVGILKVFDAYYSKGEENWSEEVKEFLEPLREKYKKAYETEFMVSRLDQIYIAV